MKGSYTQVVEIFRFMQDSKEDLTISDSSLEAQYTGTALRLESSLEANLGTVNRFCKQYIGNIK